LCREKGELEVLQASSLSAQQTARLALLDEHQRIYATQWRAHHKNLEDLLTHPTWIVVVQDFNQQDAGMSLVTQVHTLVCYAAPNGYLERHYFNYFLPKNQTNNLTAVIAVHRDFFFNPANQLIYNAQHIAVINDGGPKHFKLTGYLAHMAAVAVKLKERG
jgi:hypothetical protein